MTAKLTLTEALAPGRLEEFAVAQKPVELHPDGAARFEAVLSAMVGNRPIATPRRGRR